MPLNGINTMFLSVLCNKHFMPKFEASCAPWSSVSKIIEENDAEADNAYEAHPPLRPFVIVSGLSVLKRMAQCLKHLSCGQGIISALAVFSLTPSLVKKTKREHVHFKSQRLNERISIIFFSYVFNESLYCLWNSKKKIPQ